MRWVEVPSLQVTMSEQRYAPLGDGVVRFQAGDFVSDIEFDAEGFVVTYPGIGARPLACRPGLLGETHGGCPKAIKNRTLLRGPAEGVGRRRVDRLSSYGPTNSGNARSRGWICPGAAARLGRFGRCGMTASIIRRRQHQRRVARSRSLPAARRQHPRARSLRAKARASSLGRPT
jgi:Putative glycolipid-binding